MTGTLPSQEERDARCGCRMRHAWMDLAWLRGRVTVVVHGPRGCSHPWGARSAAPGFRARTTALDDLDVIRGAADRLRDEVRRALREDDPEAVVVLGTCASELIGDDLVAVCRECAAESGRPVLPLQVSGIPRNGQVSGRGEVLRELLLGLGEPGEVLPRSVNWFRAGWPQDDGLGTEVQDRLHALGIEVVAAVPGPARIDDLRRGPRAALNVHVEDGEKAALCRVLEERFGTPSLALPPPFGIRRTSLFFFRLCERLGCDGRATILGWEDGVLAAARQAAAPARGARVALVGDASDLPLAEALRELDLDVTWLASTPLSRAARTWCDGRGIAIVEGGANPGGFDLVLGPHGPPEGRMPDLRPPAYHWFYPGAVSFAREVAAELTVGRDFRRRFGGYMR